MQKFVQKLVFYATLLHFLLMWGEKSEIYKNMT